MSELTVEEIKRIAEGRGVDITFDEYGLSRLVFLKDTAIQYDPTDDCESNRVLKSLVELCKEKDVEIGINDGVLEICESDGVVAHTFVHMEFNNLSICKAYLAVLDQ